MHMIRNTPPARRRADGFSLIEVLVAVFVLSVGLLGIASLQVRAMQGNHSAFLRTQAATLAYTMLDGWRASHRSVLGSGDEPPGMDAWRERVARILPQGQLEVSRSGDILRLSLSWTDTRYREAGGRTSSHESAKTTTFTLGGRL